MDRWQRRAVWTGAVWTRTLGPLAFVLVAALVGAGALAWHAAGAQTDQAQRPGPAQHARAGDGAHSASPRLPRRFATDDTLSALGRRTSIAHDRPTDVAHLALPGTGTFVVLADVRADGVRGSAAGATCTLRVHSAVGSASDTHTTSGARAHLSLSVVQVNQLATGSKAVVRCHSAASDARSGRVWLTAVKVPDPDA